MDLLHLIMERQVPIIQSAYDDLTYLPYYGRDIPVRKRRPRPTVRWAKRQKSFNKTTDEC